MTQRIVNLTIDTYRSFKTNTVTTTIRYTGKNGRLIKATQKNKIDYSNAEHQINKEHDIIINMLIVTGLSKKTIKNLLSIRFITQYGVIR